VINAETTRQDTVEAWIFSDADSSLRRYHIVGESLCAMLRTRATARTEMMLREMRVLPPFSIPPMASMNFPSTSADVIAANARFASGEWSVDEAFVAIGGDIDSIPIEVQP